MCSVFNSTVKKSIYNPYLVNDLGDTPTYNIVLVSFCLTSYFTLSYLSSWQTLQAQVDMINVIYGNQHNIFLGVWVKYENYRYYFSDKKINQSQARAYCHRYRSELACINSLDEHDYLNSQIANRG